MAGGSGMSGDIAFRTVQANGITMRLAEQGEGPVVLLCHGWPEGWYSWRHQLPALAQAGYRAVAPDMRGYGGTDAPEAIDAYTQLHIVGDMVELLDVLEAKDAVIVGHDWGAIIAWMAALLRPDRFRAVVGMSVPYAPPGRISLLDALAKRGISNFYIQYFQTPGVAEAELERDLAASLRRVLYAASGDDPEVKRGFAMLPPGGGLLDATVEPTSLPGWLTTADIDHMAGEFRRSGFRGGLNYYRNLHRSWELLAPWRGLPIRQPSMFIAGERDGVLRFAGSRETMEAYPRTLPALRGSLILPGAGHWIQQERPAEVTAALLDFLSGLG
jgi:pimeloyl-ACP methyl ester carboxylesterase